LQLKNIFAVLFHLRFFSFAKIVLIAFAKRLSYFDSADPYCSMLIIQRMQHDAQPLSSLSLQYSYKSASVLRALCIVLDIVTVAAS
jgi:hypothetical protein